MSAKSKNIEELVARYLDFWKMSDIDGLMSMYDTTMEYHNLPSGEVISYQNLKQFLIDTFANESDQQLKLKESTFIEGNSAFIHWSQTFTNTDTGRQVRVNGVELIVFHGGMIDSIHEFYEFQGTQAEVISAPGSGSHLEKMTKLGLTNETMKLLASELSDYLDQEQPYLQPDLTLSSVSEGLGYTRNQVSYVINHALDRTFYDLVNARRIDHAIRKMSQLEHNMSILELGFDAGFNSVSGFYNAFRKQTDMTPAQYMRNLNP